MATVHRFRHIAIGIRCSSSEFGMYPFNLDIVQAFRRIHMIWPRPKHFRHLFKQFRHRKKTKIFELFWGGSESFQLQGKFSEMLCHRLSHYPCSCATVNDFQDTLSVKLRASCRNSLTGVKRVKRVKRMSQE